MTHLTTSRKSIARLEKEIENVEEKLKYYEDSKSWKIWSDELDEFGKEYQKYLKANPMNQKFQSFNPQKN